MTEKILLCDVEKCTQCFSCFSACPRKCIRMSVTDEGFKYPVIDKERCIECGLCMKVCHQLNLQPGNTIQKVYAAWAADTRIRQQSSSGGIFSVLGSEILREKGVVFGAAYKAYLRVGHIGVSDIESLKYLRGSKYIISDLEGIFSEVKQRLEHGQKVLFTGVPCQIAGLKAFLRKEYNNLYLVDLVCHGVPSQLAFDNYLSKIGILPQKNDDFQFRYCRGWGFELSLNKRRIPVKHIWYLKAFTRGYMFMKACYTCQYANTDRMGDLTLADFWGIGAESLFPYPAAKGVSLLSINTAKGEGLLFLCKHNIFQVERELKEAVAGNHNLAFVSELPEERTTFYRDCMLLSETELKKKYHLFPTWKDYLRPLKRRIYTILKR